MGTRDLGRLESVIGSILRIGVLVSAVLMAAGLAMTALALPHAASVLNVGLVLLMLIPTARIVVSFVDAAVRRDVLLAVSTAIVIAVIAQQIWVNALAR